MEDYDKIKYLKLLSKEYKNINEVSEEIINLQAIINLPKGTEMFLSDIHGEYAPFVHILNNGAGIIKSKIEDIYRKYHKQKRKSNTCNFNILSRAKTKTNERRTRRFKWMV